MEIWRRLCYFFRTHLEHARVIFFASVKIIRFREDYENDNAKSNTFFNPLMPGGNKKVTHT